MVEIEDKIVSDDLFEEWPHAKASVAWRATPELRSKRKI